MTSRIHAFDALDNFRDYGGYDTAAGRALKAGRLFRSAHQASVTERDLERLAALDLGVVVDLRRPVERRRQPSKRPAGFRGQVLESDLDARGEAPHITFLKSADLTPDSGRAFMTATYRELAFAPAHIDLFSRYFRALGETDRPVLIHCAAGKDRTGVLAALTHHLLGVGRDDLMEDYLLTNTAVDLVGRAPAIAEQLKALTGRTAAPDAVVAFMGVEPVYLNATIAAVTERYGSIDGYLEQALGVDAALRDRIAERLAA